MTHQNKGHIFLAGFMGAGKSTIGRMLAYDLNRSLLDTDDMIVAKMGRSIPDIFQSLGEEVFRNLETQILQEIAERQESAIVSLGGGAILREQNWESIHKSGRCFYLDWPIATLLKRILTDMNRPLVAGVKRKERELELTKLWQGRQPYYRKADFLIPCTDDMSPGDIADLIIAKIHSGKW